jgi:hypothetical protein
MRRTVYEYDFLDDERLKDNFSYHGIKALYEMLSDYEADTGEELEYDPIAFRCDFAEYSGIKELQGDYPQIKDMEDLYDHTWVYEFEQGIIIQKF